MRIHPSFIDIVFLLVTFFITSTVLLMSYANQQPELTLPALELAKSNVNTVRSGEEAPRVVTLSIKKSGEEYQYYLDETLLSFAELKNRLEATNPRQVSLRVARDVVHAVENEVFGLLIGAGIQEVSFVAGTEVANE